MGASVWNIRRISCKHSILVTLSNWLTCCLKLRPEKFLFGQILPGPGKKGIFMLTEFFFFLSWLVPAGRPPLVGMSLHRHNERAKTMSAIYAKSPFLAFRLATDRASRPSLKWWAKRTLLNWPNSLLLRIRIKYAYIFFGAWQPYVHPLLCTYYYHWRKRTRMDVLYNSYCCQNMR